MSDPEDSITEAAYTRTVVNEPRSTAEQDIFDLDTVAQFAPPPDPKLVFPVKSWERYEFIELIGEGGMGSVFKARDCKLNRSVALKFIRSTDDKMIQRFFQEARVQARIEHENICKVYEVGEVEGRPFIAMQYIEGESLKQAKNYLSLTEKVKIVKDAAEAMHAAHRLGLIHRDIKPANIMLERTSNGGWHTYVMDFGLAREVAAAGQTRTGMLMGTPAYMSPEQIAQAFGEHETLDHHSDIYSLGVTLYELFTGKTPFKSDASMEQLMMVLQADAVPVRKHNAEIPLDLETIVMKCLEKEPERRYASAAALAEDLQRFLDGEPIQARPTTLIYRVKKRARKNRTLVAVSAAALLAILILAGFVLQARWAAQEQARLAQRFGQEVKEIEAIVRYAALLPLHDTRRELALVRARMKRVEAEIDALGSIAAAPGHYALGRGHMALRDYQQARDHMERAWALGYQAPEVSYALGQVLGTLYQKALEEAERLSTRELREARKREIEKEYRDPALRYLRAASSAEVESSAYVEGLIALYERRYQDALAKAAQAFTQVSWLYEAKQLEGDVYVALGSEKQEHGDYPGALADYGRAGEAYRAAAAMGESDATIYEGECGRLIRVMEVENERGGQFQQSFEQALAACDRALVANPDSGEAYTKKSLAYVRWSRFRMYYEDPRAAIAQAVTMGEAAARINPGDVYAYNNIGSAYIINGVYERRHGRDPRESLSRAIESYQKALQINANLAFPYNGMGNAYATIGKYEIERGLDARASFDRAIENYQRSVEVNPNYAFAYNNISLSYRIKGEYELDSGLDPTVSLQRAIESCQRGAAINPNSTSAYSNLFGAYYTLARYRLARNQDPADAVTPASAAIEEELKRDTKNYGAYHGRAQLELLMARWQISQQRAPAQHFERARAALEKTLQLNSKNVEAYQTMAELHRWQAEWRLSEGAPVEKDVSAGLLMVEKALALNPQFSHAIAVRGALQLIAARARKTSLQPGLDEIKRALAMNRLLAREYQPLLTTETRRD